MPAAESVITQARTARFLAFLICVSPASAWAAYQTQYVAFYGVLIPKSVPVPLAEWLTAGMAVMLAVAALLVLRSRGLHHRHLLGGLLALGAVTALIGASGLHVASEAQAKPTLKFFSQNRVPFTCAPNITFPGGNCFNGIAIPDNQDPAADPELVTLANPYDQPVRILQLSLQTPGDPALGEAIHLAPTGQTCFENDTLPPPVPETSCIEFGTTGEKSCFDSTVVLAPGETCTVVLVEDNP